MKHSTQILLRVGREEIYMNINSYFNDGQYFFINDEKGGWDDGRLDKVGDRRGETFSCGRVVDKPRRDTEEEDDGPDG